MSGVNLYSFNADMVAIRFNVPLERTLERLSMRFMYKITEHELLKFGAPEKNFHFLIMHTASDKIETRYKLLNTQAADFFVGHENINKDALTVAVICGEHTNDINREEETEKHSSAYDNDNRRARFAAFPHDGFSDEVTRDAKAIWKESQDIKKYGYFANPESFSRESLFLAHVNAFEYLSRKEITMEYDYAEQHKLFLEQTLPRIREILCHGTSMSDVLKSYIDFMEAKTKRKLSSLKSGDMAVAHLTLLPSS